MTVERIVVGASGHDEASRVMARQLRDAGHEVVFVGGHQTPEQIVRTAVAEDADRIVIDATPTAIVRIIDLCHAEGVTDIAVGTGS